MSESFEENELYGSVSVSIKEKIANHLYGTFVIAWCVSNWRAIFIAFFTSEDQLVAKTGMLKIDYILNLYPFSGVQSVLLSLLKLVVVPSISVYLFIWLFSGIDFLVFKKAVSNKVGKIIEQKRQTEKLLKIKKDVLEKETKVIEQEEKKIKAEKKKESSLSETWEKEYSEATKQSLFNDAMTDLNLCIYRFEGEKTVIGQFRFDAESLSFLHLNDLIEEPTTSKIKMTDKGRFFLKKYVKSK